MFLGGYLENNITIHPPGTMKSSSVDGTGNLLLENIFV